MIVIWCKNCGGLIQGDGGAPSAGCICQIKVNFINIPPLPERFGALSLEQLSRYAQEGWDLANERTRQWKDVELQAEELRGLLIEADSHLSAIIHRFDTRMPGDFVKDIRQTVDKIRRVSEKRNHEPPPEAQKPPLVICDCGVPGCMMVYDHRRSGGNFTG